MQKILLYLLFILLPGLSFAQSTSDDALAREFLRNGDFPKAADLYETIYNQRGDDGSYNNMLAALMKSNQFDRAEKIVSKQFKRSPSSRYMVDLGTIAKQSGSAAKAKELFAKAIDQLPKDRMAIVNLCQQFYAASEPEYAIQSLKKGRQLLQDETAFTYDLIRLYSLTDNKSGAYEEVLNQLSMEPDYLSQAKNTLTAALKEPRDYENFRILLQKRIGKNANNAEFAELMIWQYLQCDDYRNALEQAERYDKSLGEEGERLIKVGQAAMNAGEFDLALKAFANVVDRGKSGSNYGEAKMNLITAKNRKVMSGKYEQSDLSSLETDYQSLLTEFGMSAESIPLIREMAYLQAFYLKKPQEAIKLLEDAQNIPRLGFTAQAACKLDLADAYIVSGDPWEASLLYGQVDKSMRDNPVGHDARFRAARLSFWTGNFDWAKGQLDVLKASTSQLFANDALNLSLVISDNLGPDSLNIPLNIYARADLLIFENQFDKAQVSLDSIKTVFPTHELGDDVLMAEARIYIKKGDFAEATQPLTALTEKYKDGIWADDALFTLASLYDEHLKDNAKAQALYERILTEYPGSLFVAEARKRFRALRGDLIN